MADNSSDQLTCGKNITFTKVVDQDDEKKPHMNGDIPEGLRTHAPPDGGLRAWLVCFASALCNGILFGIINCYGIIYVDLLETMQKNKVENAEAKCSLVGSLAIGSTFFFSWVSGILTDKLGIRLTAIIGAVLAFGGIFLSSFVVHTIEYMYATYGLMYGIGASLIYTPSLVILGHYFDKKIGVVNGLVTCGSSVVTAALPPSLGALLPAVGVANTLRVEAAMVGILIPCCLLFKPVIATSSSLERSGRGPSCCPSLSYMNKVFNVKIWKNKRYVIWALCIPASLFGYFVPYVHLPEYVKVNFENADGKWLVLCIGLTSGFGRIVAGFFADNPKVNRIVLQQISFISIGILTICITFARDFNVLIGIAFGLGIFDGTFISLLGPIAFQLCGPEGASQAIGNLLALCSFPLTIGPPVAGAMHEHFGSYMVPFIVAGVSPILGAFIMTVIHRIPIRRDAELTVVDTRTTLLDSDTRPQLHIDSKDTMYGTSDELCTGDYSMARGQDPETDSNNSERKVGFYLGGSNLNSSQDFQP